MRTFPVDRQSALPPPTAGGEQALGLTSAAAAALGYGLWALLVNLPAGISAGVTAAAVQGGYSFVLTLSLAVFIEWLSNRLGPRLTALAAVIVITWTLLFCLAYAIQWLAGTPQILLTILPGWIIGMIYSAGYAILTRRRPRP